MKTKLLIILLFVCVNLWGQVPDNATFSLSDVTGVVNPVSGKIARVDQISVEDFSEAGQCAIGCNGVSHVMYWETNISNSIDVFLDGYAYSYGEITLTKTDPTAFTFTAQIAGVDFASASITAGAGEASTLTANGTGTASNDLIACFESADPDEFDPTYFPYYNGDVNVSSSLLNFRNYHGTLSTPSPDPPIATAGTGITTTSFNANWEESYSATGYYLDVSGFSDFSSFLAGYNNRDVGNITTIHIPDLYSLSPSTNTYYRVRAYNTYGTSASSNTITVTTSATTVYIEDWYLPNIYELQYMYDNLKVSAIGNFLDQPYWSVSLSSQRYIAIDKWERAGCGCTNNWNPDIYLNTILRNVYIINFANNDAFARRQGNLYLSRPVRSFIAGLGDYEIGDAGPSGGWIFYVDGVLYKECSPSNISVRAWRCAIVAADCLKIAL